MSTLIKTAFRVKSSQGTQAGATQGSPQIQAKDSLSSELRHVCAKGLTRNVITIRHTIRYVRRWERNASLVSFGAANAPPSVRSINLSNLRARAGAGGRWRGRGWNSPFAEISPLSCPKGRERGGECVRVWFLAPRILLPLRSLLP